jgi:hypothetical protein
MTIAKSAPCAARTYGGNCQTWASLQAKNASAGLGNQRGLFAPVRVTGTVQDGSQVTVWLRGGTRLEIPLVDPGSAGTVLGAILRADAEAAGGQSC